MSRTGELVRVLEVDPDLAESLDAESQALARGMAIARVDLLERGDWRGDKEYPESAGHFGLLMIDGLLSRTVELGNRSCVEMLGPGDFLRPWVKIGAESAVPLESHWTVVQPARVAVLNRRFAQTIARSPEIAAAILDRVMLRSRWLAFHLAVCQLKRIESRLLVVLWHFAGRWGRVGPKGVSVPLPVTHQMLAGIIGAQRPSVTSALGELRRAGVVERQPDGTWLLHGAPPEEMAQVAAIAAGRPLSPTDLSDAPPDSNGSSSAAP
jgi:CRP/FNR family transcriptional regulator, cyclic AMP receptor protein